MTKLAIISEGGNLPARAHQLHEGQNKYLQANPQAALMMQRSRDGETIRQAPDLSLHAFLLTEIRDALVLLGHKNSLTSEAEQKLLVRHVADNIKRELGDLKMAEIKEAFRLGVAGAYKLKPEEVIFLSLPNILDWLRRYHAHRSQVLAFVERIPEPQPEFYGFGQLEKENPELAAKINQLSADMASFGKKKPLEPKPLPEADINKALDIMAQMELSLIEADEQEWSAYYHEARANRKRQPAGWERAKELLKLRTERQKGAAA